MPITLNDLKLPKDKLEKEYQVISVLRWQKERELFGRSYEYVLSKLRFENEG